MSAAAQHWLAAHHGVITTANLHRCGVGRKAIRTLADAGVLRRVADGVFVITSTPPSLEQRCAVLCAAHPAGFVTGPTAGMFEGLRRMPLSAALHFSIRHGVHLPGVAGVRFRQTTKLDPSDRRRRTDGIVVASPARLAFDLAADLGVLDHLSAVEQLLHERRVTAEQLLLIGRRLVHPGRPGSAVFACTMERLDGTPVVESHPERLVADALERRGVSVERQVRVLDLPGGRTARIDLAVSAAHWGVEVDVHPEHRSFEGFAKDASRTRALHLVGWQVEQVSEADLDDVERLADELVRLYRRRLLELGFVEPPNRPSPDPSVEGSRQDRSTLGRAETLGSDDGADRGTFVHLRQGNRYHRRSDR
ncbi:MAG: type IV toxin-antitoxin system AbiEi family antitoxin domain-containing protein [Ilumatobacteraceae bacterium]